MLIYNHYTAGDVIDLDDDTGLWTPVGDDDRVPSSALAMAFRHAYQVRGSYTVENDKRYCAYWTDDGVFVLRTPDNQRHLLFKRLGTRRYLNLMAGMQVELEEAKYGDGRLQQGFSTYRLRGADGAVLDEATYNSRRYVEAHMQDFTGAEDNGVADWDFFVALEEAVQELGAMAVAPAEAVRAAPAQASEVLVSARSGETCARSGFWVVADDIGVRRHMTAGMPLPLHGEREVSWILVE